MPDSKRQTKNLLRPIADKAKFVRVIPRSELERKYAKACEIILDYIIRERVKEELGDA